MKFWLSMFCCFFFLPVLAQRTELQARAGSGLFFFHGISAEKNQNGLVAGGQLFTRPYGRKPGGSVTIELMLKRVSRSKFIAGISAGYQRLSSRSTIDTVFLAGDVVPIIDTFPVDGHSTFKGSFINLAPFAGRRFMIGKMPVDLVAGMEFGFILDSKEELSIKGSYTSNAKIQPDPRDIDIRLHLSADVNIRKMIVFAKYARGITNYYPRYIGGQPEAYSNFIQLGIGYRLR